MVAAAEDRDAQRRVGVALARGDEAAEGVVRRLPAQVLRHTDHATAGAGLATRQQRRQIQGADVRPDPLGSARWRSRDGTRAVRVRTGRGIPVDQSPPKRGIALILGLKLSVYLIYDPYPFEKN